MDDITITLTAPAHDHFHARLPAHNEGIEKRRGEVRREASGGERREREERRGEERGGEGRGERGGERREEVRGEEREEGRERREKKKQACVVRVSVWPLSGRPAL